ncbi:MAG TPA: DNA adenine methylase [Candidatus Woesebacteria bacterium]|nr:DNA adenine methylase [Candidatus Woesebacteria bacterium]
MKYMGSKRELLESISTVIDTKLKNGSVLLDLFSGTCGVGSFFRDRYSIYSNDIQTYSSAISKGIVESELIQITKEKIKELLLPNFDKNKQAILNNIPNIYKKSRNFIEENKWNTESLKEYLSFIQSLPDPSLNGQYKSDDKENTWLHNTYFSHQQNPSKLPYIQTTFLFSEMYFSLEQSIDIDSIKFAIDKLDNENLKNILNTALIHAYSYNSAGTGHFAQFRDLSTLSSVKDVFLYRTRSVWDYFLRKAEEIIMGTKITQYASRSKSFSMDYVDLLNNKELMSKVGLIYADPPYSFVHYSRFYHAIEDLCRYDYPTVEFKGRYRMDRHQSPFCIKSKVPKAFETLLSKAKAFNIPVLISYSNTGMIDLNSIIFISEEVGYRSEVIKLAHKHSTMGRLNDKDRDVTEALIMCS